MNQAPVRTRGDIIIGLCVFVCLLHGEPTQIPFFFLLALLLMFASYQHQQRTSESA